MTLAIIVIALLVLLVIVDGSETSGAHREPIADDQPFSPDDQEQPATGRSCILNVTPFWRNATERRRPSRKPARQEQAETARR